MIDFLLQVLWQTWNILKQASIFLLFGFLLAGVLAVLVPEKALSKLFRTGKIKSVLWASAIGAPLPLCSCGVLPAALGLRRQGATPGATAAFLISTPETGLDSISISYALTDPIITVFRPVTAVLTAICAGIGVNYLGGRNPGGNGRFPHRNTRDRGRFHQPELRSDGPDHHRVPSACGRLYRHHRRHLDQSIRRSQETWK